MGNNKLNNIRKKALEHAKKGHWEKALEEFLRLVEVEQHNPNLFNEIGDIQLKLANKREAYQQYHAAIAAYAKVGLLNNAIAVCKKILRLNPADDVVYGRMATLRQSQGFVREASSYALQFFERVMKNPNPPDDTVRSIVRDIVESDSSETDVLERAAQCLAAWDAPADACDVLEKLEKTYAERGLSAERDRTRAKLKSFGRAVAAPQGSEPGAAAEEKPQTIETHRPSSGAAAPGFDVPFGKTVPPHIRRGHGGDVAADFGVIDVGSPKPAASKERPSPVGAGADTQRETRPAARSDFEPDPSVLCAEAPTRAPASVAAPAGPKTVVEDREPAPVKEYVIPMPDGGNGLGETLRPDPTDQAAPSAPAADIDLASEVKADVEAGDYRSHYDLGMAYLEMGLLSEALREFQFAAQSPAFKVRSSEMIGRCYLTQNQPDLAIKQLTMGLALVDGDDRSALGIKYSLALAYEMAGDPARAKAFFQEVCVVDGTFRDVQEKIRKYAR